LIHKDNKIIFVNESSKNLFNFKGKEEIMGRDILDFIVPEFREIFIYSIEETIKKKGALTFSEIEIYTFDGEKRWIEKFDYFVEFKDKPSIISFLRDITQIREKEERYERLFSNIFDGVYVSTHQGELLFANLTLVNMLGFESKEGLFKIPINSFYFNTEDRNYIVEELERKNEIRNYEVRLKKKDGSILFAINNSWAIRDKSGRVIFHEGTLTDITERKVVKEQLKMGYERLKGIFESIINAMVKMVEIKNPHIAGHERNVAKLAAAIARELGFSEEKSEEIRLTALIHDIGKMFIPSEILLKPCKLSKEEYAFIKLHTYHGYEVLKTIDFPWDIASVVLQHHERFDGSGYPQGLSCDDILMEAKILSVADVVEAINSPRPYRVGYGIELALEEIKRFRGILYDPDVVDACLKLFIEKSFSFKNSEN
ncbi:MAG: HD domain-containing phosphohydrolase, partial [Candidatus Aminicenantia bacterium]